MNEIETKVRKQWLTGFFVLQAVTLINLFYTYFISSVLDISGYPEGQLMKCFSFGTSILTALVFAYAMYHCGYKKRGTKFLMFLLYMYPTSFVFTAAAYALNLVPIPQESVGFWISSTVGFGVNAWFYVLVLKLRKANLLHQRA